MYHSTDCNPPDQVNTLSKGNESREIRQHDLAATKVSRLACLTSLVNVSLDRLQSPSSANGSITIRPRDLAAKKVARLAYLTSLVNVSRDRL
jgi:hypothetical protein